MLPQDREGKGVERDGSSLVALGRPHHPAAVQVVLDRPPYVQPPGADVDVLPLQTGQLPPAETSRCRQRDRSRENRLPSVLGCSYQLLDDLRAGDLLGLVAARWGSGARSWRGHDETPLDGLVERGGEDPVEVMDAARIEAFGQPGPIGAVEVLGGELVQGDLAELGGDPLRLEPVAP